MIDNLFESVVEEQIMPFPGSVCLGELNTYLRKMENIS